MTSPMPPPRGLSRGAVASENDTVTRVGTEILDAGGSATDAVVAMAFAAGVTQPTSCGLGGGGLGMFSREGRPAVIDFRETAPRTISASLRPSTPTPWMERGATVGAPGFVAGLAAAHGTGGVLPWDRVLEPSRRLAEDGFVVEAWLAHAIAEKADDLRRLPAAAHLLPDGRPARRGDVLRSPSLGRALRRIASHGPSAFYTGEIAQDVAQSAADAGGTLTTDDLRAFAPVERSPWRIPWGDAEVWLPPAPSGGASVVGQLLLAFPPADVERLVPGSGLYTHFVAEVLRDAEVVRAHHVGDPAFVPMDVAAVLDPDRLRALRASLRPDATRMPRVARRGDRGTCSFVAWDAADGIAALSASIGGPFGARIASQSGFFLNESLTDFDEHAEGPNAMRPAARPDSSMAPLLVTRAGAPVLALAASGGSGIPSALVQVLHRALCGSASLESAIAAPRFLWKEDGGVAIEPGLASILDDLVMRGERVEAPKPTLVAVTGMRRDVSSSRLEAIGDPRKR